MSIGNLKIAIGARRRGVSSILPPSNIQLFVTEDTEITALVTASESSIDGYVWQYSVDGVTFLTHGTSITPQYVFTSLSIGKLYYFRCYAYKGSTYSEFCEAGQAQTFPQFLLDGNTELWSDHKDAVYDGSNAVSRMVDKSGKNHHLDLFNGSPTKTATGILFDGVDDLLQTSFSFPRPQYAYLIMRYID